MNANEFGSTVGKEAELTQLTQVGGVRAMRLRRDVGISTIPEVAEASIDSLMGVWSVGPVRARQIMGSAQGWIQQRRAERKSMTRTKRVAVVAGKDSFSKLHDRLSPKEVLLAAFDFADVDWEENDVEIGHVADGMGGERIGTWLDMQCYFTKGLQRCTFHTPWDKYKRFTDPIKFVDSDWKEKHGVWTNDELPAGQMPSTADLSTLPFDVTEPKDVGLWMAPAERTNDMVNWADEVVIVLDGEYADRYRQSCEYRNTKCTTVFAEPSGIPAYEMYFPSEDDTADFKPDADEQVSNSTTLGRNYDLDDDEMWHDAPFDSDEGRMLNGRGSSLLHYDPGGKGAGKNEGRWG